MTSWFYTVGDEPEETAGGVVPLSAQAFARMLRHLLPPGPLWNLLPTSLLSKVLLAAGDELARVSQRAADLVEEADPRTTTELLEDFERVLALEADGTTAERRARVVGHLVRRQRYRPEDFQQALAAMLGQDAADVAVIERSRADAIAMDDDQAIYHAFIYRDPALAGSYDLDSAQALASAMKPTHTKVTLIESDDFLCDDPNSLCDRDILGA